MTDNKGKKLEDYADVLTVKEVQDILHIGRNRVYKMLRNNDIPNKKIGIKYIIPKQGLIDFLNIAS